MRSRMSQCSQPPCPAYVELVDVMSRTTERLDLPWKREKRKLPHSCLDERYLSGLKLPAGTSLPFLPDLHVELRRSWGKPYSAYIHHSQANYADVEVMQEYCYVSCLEETNLAAASHITSKWQSTCVSDPDWGGFAHNGRSASLPG